jgi:hypothetical protein
MPKRKNDGGLTPNENIDVLSAAINGDMSMTITPTTVTTAATAAAWTRNVNIKIVDDNGLVHSWLTQDFTTTLSIADTSTAGTASITSTTLSIVDGKADVTVSGDAQNWLAAETDTLTVGNLTILGYTVTGGTSVETFA